MDVEIELSRIEAAGNLRVIPRADTSSAMIDLSSNDYLGLAQDMGLRQQFLETLDASRLQMTSSASRLLSACQSSFTALEDLLTDSYGRPALLFNSGYHANTGLVAAIGSRSGTLIVADRLVHASIIDGIRLSGAPFERFRHNDYGHLQRILEAKASRYTNVLIVVESVYSMDGDMADLPQIVSLKRHYPNASLYVDEAHAVGVIGPGGLGLSHAAGVERDVDILVGTLGKALASTGAYAILDETLRAYMVNRARSLIFSTALPPACADWSVLTWRRSLDGDDLRDRLGVLGRRLATIIPGGAPSHIRPLLTGSADRAVDLSRQLAAEGFKVLPIRTSTVPPGTERLRFSLSAAIGMESLDRLGTVLKQLCGDVAQTHI